MSGFNAAITSNLFYVVLTSAIIILILIALIISLKSDVSDMKKRYKKMMAGSDGVSLEKMLLDHVEEVKDVVEEQKRTRDDIKRIDALLQKAITKKAVIRFSAFEDVGADLSYCVAMLDDENNGVIFSTINGRDTTRSYVKPIEGGICKHYKLSGEEEQVLNEAKRK